MSNRPIYAEMSEDLIRKIRKGSYPVGTLLPTELELAAERGVSRATVRAALERLTAMGFVTRQKGVGTRVVASNPGGYNASTASLEELAHFGAATERKILDSRDIVADEVLAQQMGCPPGRHWHKITAMRAAPGSDALPICWTDNYISPSFSEIAGAVPGQRGLIADLIAERYGIVVDEVTQIIRPIQLSEPVALALGTDPQSPALEIVRRYTSAGSTIYISISQHPADRFEYRMSLKRR